MAKEVCPEHREPRAPSHMKDEVLKQLIRFTSDFYLQIENLKFSLVNVRKKQKPLCSFAERFVSNWFRDTG